MQRRIKNKSMKLKNKEKLWIMKKIFFTIFSISQICFLLLCPEEAVVATKEGMGLWLNILLPTLLPFLILTGVLIQTGMTEKLLKPAELIWNKALGITSAGAYAVLIGALCGYPVGAKITSDLYENHQIGKPEALYLLTFTNHASPVFIRTYLCHICLGDQIPVNRIFGILLLSDLAVMFFFRFVVFKDKIRQSSVGEKKKTSVSSSSGAFLDVSIMNGVETITRLGGYILMFSILSACISHFWNMENIPGYIVSGILELTTGLCRLQNAKIHLLLKHLLALFFTAFGGICITFQTRSLVTRELSLIPYITAKLLNGTIAVIFALFFAQIV